MIVLHFLIPTVWEIYLLQIPCAAVGPTCVGPVWPYWTKKTALPTLESMKNTLEFPTEASESDTYYHDANITI